MPDKILPILHESRALPLRKSVGSITTARVLTYLSFGVAFAVLAAALASFLLLDVAKVDVITIKSTPDAAAECSSVARITKTVFIPLATTSKLVAWKADGGGAIPSPKPGQPSIPQPSPDPVGMVLPDTVLFCTQYLKVHDPPMSIPIVKPALIYDVTYESAARCEEAYRTGFNCTVSDPPWSELGIKVEDFTRNGNNIPEKWVRSLACTLDGGAIKFEGGYWFRGSYNHHTCNALPYTPSDAKTSALVTAMLPSSTVCSPWISQQAPPYLCKTRQTKSAIEIISLAFSLFTQALTLFPLLLLTAMSLRRACGTRAVAPDKVPDSGGAPAKVLSV